MAYLDLCNNLLLLVVKIKSKVNESLRCVLSVGCNCYLDRKQTVCMQLSWWLNSHTLCGLTDAILFLHPDALPVLAVCTGIISSFSGLEVGSVLFLLLSHLHLVFSFPLPHFYSQLSEIPYKGWTLPFGMWSFSVLIICALVHSMWQIPSCWVSMVSLSLHGYSFGLNLR